MNRAHLSLVVLILSAPIVSTAFAANATLARGMADLMNDDRREAFPLLEEAFLKGTPQEKSEAAELLTSAIIGETKQHPGFYAEYLLSSAQKSDQRTRWLRLAGDYFLKNGKLDLAHARYDELEKIGNDDDKDFARYKRAWVYLNESKNPQAADTLIDLLTRSKNSKLRLSAAFDLGRFWGEIPAKDRPQSFFASALSQLDEKREFYRGVQKTLLLPKKMAERIQLKSEVAALPESQYAMMYDLEAKAPSRTFACEKLDWSAWPETLKKVEGEGPYITLTECFADDKGNLQKLKENERRVAFQFIDNLQVVNSTQALHRARFLSNLSEFARACLDYDRAMAELSNQQTDLCEEALGVCSKGLTAENSQTAVFHVLKNTLGCAKTDQNSRALGVVLELYEKKPQDIKAFVLERANKNILENTLIPDLLYEKVLQAKDQAFAKNLAETYFFENSTKSAERRKSLEHFLAMDPNAGKKVDFDDLRATYPLQKDGKSVVDNLPVWLNAWNATRNPSNSPPAELVSACEDPSLRNSVKEDFRNFCFLWMDPAKAWIWVAQNKWDCKDYEPVIVRSWVALEDGKGDAIKAQRRARYLVETYQYYASESYVKANEVLSKACKQKFLLSDQIAQLAALKKASTSDVRNLNEFSKRVQWIKDSIAKTSKDVRIHQNLFNRTKAAIVQAVDKLEQSLERLQKDQPEASEALQKFKKVFEDWKKELS